MQKTLIASAIALSLGSAAAQADIVVTSMVFSGTYAASGTLLDAGGGTLASVDPFFYHTWTAAQQTTFMDSTDSWSGTSLQGTFNFDSYIAGMTANQRAVGLYFDWNGSNEIAVMEIFNCDGGVCTGNGTPMANGPFKGSVAIFNGTGSCPGCGPAQQVPVPAAAWLMGSGLLGLVGVARRRRKQA